MMAVAVSTEPTFVAGTPERLFDIAGFTLTNTRSVDIGRDGAQFLMLKARGSPAQDSSAPAAQIDVVQDWFEELNARVPVP